MVRVFEDLDVQTFLPQFSGKGPTFVVKNTFIDEAPAPMPPSLARARTAPACMRAKVGDVDLGARFVGSKGIFDGFSEQSDTSSNVDSDQNDSACSTTTHDESVCLGQYMAIENILPPMADFPFPVATQQPAAAFYYNSWFESQLHSSSFAYTLNPSFGQQDIFPQINLVQEDLKFGPLQANSIVAVPPQASNSKESHGHEVQQPHEVPLPQTVSVRDDPFSGGSEIVWHVDARKLRTGDKQAVSPAFELPLGNQFPSVTFKMMIYPSVKSEGKGGASFKNAKGQGRITIKCEGDVSGGPAQICFSLAVGSRGVRVSEMRHGMHNFAQSAICSLSGNAAEWDMSSVVDHASETFSIFLNMMHVHASDSANSSFVDSGI